MPPLAVRPHDDRRDDRCRRDGQDRDPSDPRGTEERGAPLAEHAAPRSPHARVRQLEDEPEDRAARHPAADPSAHRGPRERCAGCRDRVEQHDSVARPPQAAGHRQQRVPQEEEHGEGQPRRREPRAEPQGVEDLAVLLVPDGPALRRLPRECSPGSGRPVDPTLARFKMS